MIFRKKRLKTCHFPVIRLSLSCHCLRQKLRFNVTTKIYMEDRIRDPTRISSVALANEPRSCKEETKRQLSPVRCTARREIVAKRICCPEACRVLVDHSTEPVPLPIPERYIYTRRKNGSFNVWPTICTGELAKSRSMTRVLPPRIDSA